MAINPTKLLPPSSGALSLRSKTTDIGKKKSGGLEGQVLVIKTQVIKIEKLISRGYTLKLKEQKEEQKELEKNKRSKKEEELEEKKPPKEGKGKIPSLPKLGFFDRIRKFIGKTLFAYFAIRLIDHLPKLVPFATALGNASEFLLNVGGNLLNGLVTFVDWGYKAYDATRGFLKNLGGDNFTKVFDAFNGAVGNLIETAIIAAVTLSSFGGGADVPEPKRGFDTSGRRVSTETQKRYAQRFGKNQFAKRFGKSNLINLGERGASKSVLKFVKPFTKRLPIIGALLDFGLSVALGEDPGRAAFKAIGAGLLGAVGAAVGSLVFGFGGVIGGILGSIGGDAIGGALYDVLFGGKKPQQKNQKVQKKQGGGITRGGKSQGSISRKISGKEKQRRKTRVSQKPREIEFDTPGSSVGGEEKLFGIFPNPFKKVADTFNPFKNVADAGKNLGKTDYFGPILAITSKITLGQKPTEQDYKQVGLGINLLFSEGMSKGEIVGGVAAAYADGGFVDKKSLDALMEGGDITNWVARTFKDATETNAQKTLREIRENSKKKKTVDGVTPPSPDDMGMGVGVQVSSDSEDFWLLATAAMFENSHPQGAADVAQVIYNRTQYPAWNAPTIRKAILNPGQFQPVRQYGGTNAWAAIKTKEDALRFSKSHGKTQEQLERVAAALLDKSKQNDAKSFVGPRDSFRADAYERSNNHLADETEKSRHGHTFGFEPGGAMIGQFKAGKLSAAQVNAGIKGETSFYSDTDKGTGKFKVIEYITGDVNHPNLDVSGHGLPSNYHDHIAFASISEKERAKKALISSGIKIGSELRPGDPGYHGRNLAIDIPGYQWGGSGAIGNKEFSGSKKVRSVLGIGRIAPKFHGGIGFVPKDGLTLKLHKGEMFKVVDKDSVDLFGMDFIQDIIDIENKSQLIGKAPSIIERLKAISGYASYEDGAQEEVIVIQNQPLQEESYQNPMVVAMGGLSGGDSYDPFEMLDRLPG